MFNNFFPENRAVYKIMWTGQCNTALTADPHLAKVKNEWSYSSIPTNSHGAHKATNI